MANQPRFLLYGQENRQRLLTGARTFSKAVCTTYGPHGRVVMLDRTSGLISTKDGVTVAREVELDDPIANMAVSVFKTACIKVNDEAGDGTTTAACLAAAILEEGCKLVAGGMNPVHVARGIRLAATEATEYIRSLAHPVETQPHLEQVALLASNQDADVASKMAEAVMSVGKNGTVSIEDGDSVETVLLFKEGMEIDRGPASVHFLKGKYERVLEQPIVAVIAGTLRTVEDVLDLCEEATTFGGRPLLLFCEGIEGEALKTMLLNDSSTQQNFEFVAVLSPGNFDWKVEYLGDIAALSGADLLDPRQGVSWRQWNRNWFGGLQSATVSSNRTMLVGFDEASDLVRDRIAYIQGAKDRATSQYDVDRMNERLAVLEGGLCVMKIGAHTEAELKEKRARVEDALGAVQAALAEGVVPGGGAAYVGASQALQKAPSHLDDEALAGWAVLSRALLVPLKTLAQNAGKNGDYVVEKLLKARKKKSSWVGWDALTDQYRDFSQDYTVIDPTKVATKVVDAAVSAAATLLTAEASISMVSR